MLLRQPKRIKGLDFSTETVLEASVAGRFLMLTVFTPSPCNLRCPYCFVSTWTDPTNSRYLDLKVYGELCLEASMLGAESVWWVGQGEPFLLRWWKELVEVSQKWGLWTGIFTNGTQIDDKTAEFVLDRRISLYMKLNSLTPDVQGWLINSDGKAYLDKVVPRIEWFVERGMTEDGRLSVETVITRLNYGEIPMLYRWCRDREIIPFVEMMEHACQGAVELDVTPEEHVALFKELQRIDREEYGFEWDTVPPWAAYRCRNIYLGLAVDAWGNVTPCSGMRYRLGNIREKPLAEIWNSDQARMFRDPARMEPQPWDGKNLGRYGCKSHAYHVTGDPFATDPRCEWFKESNQRGMAVNGGNVFQVGRSLAEAS